MSPLSLRYLPFSSRSRERPYIYTAGSRLRGSICDPAAIRRKSRHLVVKRVVQKLLGPARLGAIRIRGIQRESPEIITRHGVRLMISEPPPVRRKGPWIQVALTLQQRLRLTPTVTSYP